MADIGYLSKAGVITLVNNIKTLVGNITLSSITGTLATNKGGTGATTVAAARTNLSVYSKSEVDTSVSAREKKYSKTTLTATTSGWTLNNSTGFYEYSLNSSYPSATYDVEVDLNWDSATDDAVSDWMAMQVVGSYSSNKLVARGGQPGYDYPLILYVTDKS
jgi:hypothetical protein